MDFLFQLLLQGGCPDSVAEERISFDGVGDVGVFEEMNDIKCEESGNSRVFDLDGVREMLFAFKYEILFEEKRLANDFPKIVLDD